MDKPIKPKFGGSAAPPPPWPGQARPFKIDEHPLWSIPPQVHVPY